MRQEDLAAAVGVGQRTISHYERGERVPDLKTALMISSVLGRPLTEIFFELAEKILES